MHTWLTLIFYFYSSPIFSVKQTKMPFATCEQLRYFDDKPKHTKQSWVMIYKLWNNKIYTFPISHLIKRMWRAKCYIHSGHGYVSANTVYLKWLFCFWWIRRNKHFVHSLMQFPKTYIHNLGIHNLLVTTYINSCKITHAATLTL